MSSPQDIAVKQTVDKFETLLKVDARAAAEFIEAFWALAQTVGMGGIIGSLSAIRERAQHELQTRQAELLSN